jgi:hypothetical protein
MPSADESAALPQPAAPVPIVRRLSLTAVPMLALGLVLAAFEWGGRSQMAWGMLPLGFGWLAAIAATLLGMPFALVRPRLGATMFLSGLGAVAAGLVVGPVIRIAREAAFERAAVAAERVITAIENYHRDRGRAPNNLSDLVPQYLLAIPSTGLPAYPEFRDELRSQWLPAGAAFELCIECPVGPLSWDVFVYWPGGEYPEQMYGGYVKRLGRWAYVYE